MNGIVQRIESKDYYVFDCDYNIVRCTLRGILKKEFNLKKNKQYTLDIAAIGDRVEFAMNKDGSGVINAVLERRNYISRKAPRLRGASHRGERLEQIIASNVDNLFVVSSVNFPKFNNRLIDRLIVSAESSGMAPNVILNKIDINFDQLEYWRNIYNSIGINFFPVSAKEKVGLQEVVAISEGRVNLFWGQSGVGKSSLLNALFPGLNLRTGSISAQTNKGRHTTVTAQMIRVGDNTFVIDTPGIREIDPYGIKKEELGHYFSEFTKYHHDCKFASCTHHHEPGCMVLDAVETGEISEERYQSYLNILNTIEDGMIF